MLTGLTQAITQEQFASVVGISQQWVDDLAEVGDDDQQADDALPDDLGTAADLPLT